MRLIKKIMIYLLFLFTITAINTNSYAYSVDSVPSKNKKWLVGLDSGWQKVEANGDFAKIFRQNFLYFNIYLGYKFNQRLGLNFGYSWNARNAKSAAIYTNGQLFNITATADGVYSAKLSHKNTYLDLYFYQQLLRKLEAFLFAGVGFARQGITLNVENGSINLINDFQQIEGKTKQVWRAGTGLQAMVVDNIGLRGIFTYQNLSSIRLRGKPTYASSKAFKNSFSLALGLFIKC